MPYIATRSKVDSNIPIIEKIFSVEARTPDFSIAGMQCNPSATPVLLSLILVLNTWDVPLNVGVH